MDSYVDTQYNHHQQENNHQQNEQQNSGLLRYRSAPSSFFFEYTQNSSDCDKYNERFREDYSESYETKPLSLDSQSGYSGSGQLPPQYPKQSGGVSTSTSMENLLDINQSAPRENGHVVVGGGLNLTRQNSSPAGFFNQLNPQNGYTIMRGLGSFRIGKGTNVTSSPRGTRLAISPLPRIPEIGVENVRETSPDEVKFRNHDQADATLDGSAGYPFTSWGDSCSESSLLSENGRPTMLTHHLSLPKTSTEMAAIEKLLHFQDSVPCKVRAKRGFATHPRSIAERVRRNRISERMRKLQDLVPNMDKQTNTADMLDLAVDYIKNLQNQFKVLSSNREKCKCVNLQ